MEDRKASLGLTRRVHSGRSAEEALKGVDLNRNIEALIENPLSHLTPEQLQRDVRAFARSNGLHEHLELLERAAQIAKDPHYFESVPGVTDREKVALGDERHRSFRQPHALYLTIIICSIGAAVQGWDQTGSNGANLNWPEAFGLNTERTSNDFWILGLVNAAPYIAASLIGCWLSHPLNYYLGRRGVVFIAAWFCFFSVLGSACTQTWVQLFICRLLLGIGMGTKAATIPVLAAESSPASIRGSLVMGWQLWVAFGIFLGFTANLVLYQIGDIAWRLQFGSAFIPAVPLIIGIYFCPESPRWYIKKHRYHDAFKSLRRLRNTPLQAARDLYYIHAQVRLEELMLGDGDITSAEGKEQYTSSGRYANRFIQLFTIARIRRATLASSVVMIAQQMCGINVMAFYSSTLFTDANASERSALLVSWGFGLINFAFAWPAVRSIDRFGRRNLLLFTFPHMAWTLLAAGFSFYIPDESPAHLGMITLFIYLFAAFYSPGEGPVPFTYSAEAFPLFHREVGMSLAVSINLFWAAVLTVVYPKLSDALTPTGAIGFFAGLNIIAFLMIFLWVPETKQRTLEELDYIFAVPTRKHMHYQVFKAVVETHQPPGGSDVEAFRLEVHTLDNILRLIERIRCADVVRIPAEEAHLKDVNRLLLRCRRRLSELLDSVTDTATEADDTQEALDLSGPSFELPRKHISFFTRTLQMALTTFRLVYHWKLQMPRDSLVPEWGQMSSAIRALRESVTQRRRLTGIGDSEECVEERGLLRDVEECVKSAEECMTMTRSQENGDSTLSRFPLPPNGTLQLPIHNGSSVGSSQHDSRTDDQASNDSSDGESVADPQPDADAADFTEEAYASIIAQYCRELNKDMSRQDYQRAEKTYKNMEKRYINREINLRIPYDNRHEHREILARIYLNQGRLPKAKRILKQLLLSTPLDAACKLRLYYLLSHAYFGLRHLPKAEEWARASLTGREKLLGKNHPLTQESALLVISILEEQDDAAAMGLRDFYCPHTILPPPPKSALRTTSTPQRQTDASGLSQFFHALSHDPPTQTHEEPQPPSSSNNHVHWAANVWGIDSGINAPIKAGKTQLIDAIHSGDEGYVELILGRDPSVEAQCVDSIRPLMHAVIREEKRMVEFLLARGAQVDATTSNWTALHKATDLGNLAIMQLLLSHDADIEAKAPFECRPPLSTQDRIKALSLDLPDPTTPIDDKEIAWTPLLRAASKGDEPAVRLLLDRGASVDARSPTN
ncbi:MAG: hypothetical protein Q9192_005214, partial [Flavoplaca navasiana]